ncbi:hypothetical protein RND71_032001 [Anisodus tanguticus]|uniref:Uncharacterized protein n=1 Tax=Anisodus tanguticus TaxID=243964 RepID=A0AAE1RCD1_9SOLA|nr:hypothetical protein RND71_032001 [Anisodus tanguticus]
MMIGRLLSLSTPKKASDSHHQLDSSIHCINSSVTDGPIRFICLVSRTQVSVSHLTVVSFGIGWSLCSLLGLLACCSIPSCFTSVLLKVVVPPFSRIISVARSCLVCSR